MPRARSEPRHIDIWPGFVDALSTSLIVITFLLLVFAVSQFLLGNALSGKDAALEALTAHVADLADLLALEQSKTRAAEARLGELDAQLAAAREQARGQEQRLRDQDATLGAALDSMGAMLREKDQARADQAAVALALGRDLALLQEARAQLERDVADLAARLRGSSRTLQAEREISARSRAQVELLNRQIGALRDQLTAIAAVLGVDLRGQTQDLSKLMERLNVALARKAQELALYRSEFFGRLRQVLGDAPGIRTVGDRFVIESAVLFASGSAEFGPQGKAQVAKVAALVKALETRVPADIDWIVRIDGHTDRRPIRTADFASNWELSTARAVSIVKQLVAHGVAPRRVVAGGFGEFHPLDPADTGEAYARNRRIEIKLTER